MAKLIYTHEPEFNEEPSTIELTINDELTIYQFKNAVSRLALAMGYASESVKQCFGEYLEDCEDDTVDGISQGEITITSIKAWNEYIKATR